MKGDELRVVLAFAAWLEQQGWTVQREVDFVDAYAERGSERIYAEAKGSTAAIGLDVDTMYGQLLRRMTTAGDGVRFAIVVPTAGLAAAQRAPEAVRRLLAITVLRRRSGWAGVECLVHSS